MFLLENHHPVGWSVTLVVRVNALNQAWIIEVCTASVLVSACCRCGIHVLVARKGECVAARKPPVCFVE